MHAALDIFMPHLRRWRSLTILTDTCSPMYAALHRLSDPCAGTIDGAQMLESIVLKRCNEYIGSYSEFLPSEMKMTPEMPFAALINRMGGDYLPRLRKLRLHGVHLNWASLPSLLPTLSGGLSSLELSEHPYEVRPKPVDFRQILMSCPGLQKLVVSVSGPVWDQDDSMDGTSTSYVVNDCPVALPHLKELTLGYTDADDAREVLKHLHAPNVKSLTITDTTSVMSSQEDDVGSLLVACGTNIWGEKEISRGSPSDVSTRFPALEEVTMDRIEVCCATPFRAFFAALPTLRRLTLQHTSMHAMQALIPLGKEDTQDIVACPCPNLRYVHIRGAALDFDLISRARIARIKQGAYAFEPEITLDHCRADDMVHVGAPGLEGTEVRIRSGDPYEAGGIDFEDTAMDLEMGNIAKEDPFSLGGAFNDPVFDTYYGPQIGILPQF